MMAQDYARERSRSPFRPGSAYSHHSHHSRSSSPALAGGWRNDALSPTSNYTDDYYNPNAYDHDLYRNYYGVEDDYYGAYGDLLDYEENLRLAADIDETERLRRWRDRLAFEELAESERLRRYELMAEEERLRLGLIGSSWWARRYGHHHSHNGRHTPSLAGGWKNSYGNRLRRWSSNRMPLSSPLASRFERIWYNPANSSRRRLSNAAAMNSKLEILNQEQIRLSNELIRVREETRMREIEIQRDQHRIEQEILLERERIKENLYRVQKAKQEQVEREIIERNRLEQEIYRDSLRTLENQRQMVDIERQRIQNQHLRNQVVSDLQSQEQELRLRRELELAGSGLYQY
ncbi:hypothetical protein MJO29_000057 [Puccinia striiformis f. sp. tritici]|nr:hypothetical protein Pst134EA_000053 [Puccinia striiformis f. sp. tritici]KAH9472969.1 hypothetical protein Pst134EA_000053 [Puccinia striiformis f. sp. tritici]KAI7966780.1 hypothetical protein MJO29_000057 [Puccinia striiformis f. sp. tritici]